jgi:histidine triad (HIT) family protein
MTDPNCLFCKIIEKQIPSNIVYEDDHVVAFKDISPQVPVHLLIVPRLHIAGLNELTPAQSMVLGHIALVAKELAKKAEIDESGWRLVTNCGPHAGQTVFHLHVHLLGGAPMSGKMV